MSWLKDLIGVREIYVDDELQPSRSRLNLVAGAGVSLEASDDSDLAATVVTIGSTSEVYVDGEPVARRDRLDLVAGDNIEIEAEDDPESNSTIVTFSPALQKTMDFICARNSVQNSNTFFPLSGSNIVSAIEAQMQWRAPVAMTLYNLRVYVPTNAIANASAFQLRVNGATAATITVTASTTGEFTAPDEVSIAAGDLVCWGFVAGAGGGNFLPTMLQVSAR